MARRTFGLALLFAIIALGCGEEEKTPLSPSPPQSNTSENPGMDPDSSKVTYADGWTGIEMIANMAKTQIGIGAHFSTSRNACGKDAYGAIPLKDWNDLAKNMNLAAQAGLSNNQDYCVPMPEDNIYLQRGGLSVDLLLPQGKHTLFEIQGDQICSSIKDHPISDAVLQALINVIIDADKEDCPNGWGS